MICSWEAWKDAFGIPCIQLLPRGIPLPHSLCAAGVTSPQLLTKSHQPGRTTKKVTPNHQDTWQSGMWECWEHPSCSMPPPSPPPRTEEQERPGWRSRLGCSETNPERYHSAVSQRPTPVPKRHQRGSAALRTLRPTRVVLPRAGGFSRGQEWARLCREVLPLRLLPRDSQTQEKRNEGWADRQTSARRGRGRRGRPRHSRQRPGDTRQSHGDTPRSQGTPPLGPPAPVPFLPARRLRGRERCPCPNPSGAGSRSPVRV